MKKLFTLLAFLGLMSGAMLADSNFPSDPGEVIVDLELQAVELGGDSIPGYYPLGGGSYAIGDSVTITARQIPGYDFLYWSDGDDKTEANRVIVMEANTSLMAMYSKHYYNVTFKNGDIELSSNEYEYGATPNEPETPVRQETAQYFYEFKGWNPEVTTVTDDAEYYAVFDSIVRTYNVRFLDWNEDILQDDTLEYGAMPQFRGNNPTREQEDGQVYWFIGWEPEITEVQEAVDYIAQYSDSTLMFTATIINGMQEQTQYVPWGTELSLSADAPTGYHFVSWSTGEIEEDIRVTVVSDTTIRANFEINRYLITFKNWNDSILQQDSVNYNVVPQFRGENPTRPEVEGVSYTFIGWEPEIAAVTADQIYTAQFSSENIQYILTAMLIVGSDTLNQSYQGIYGEEVTFNFDLSNDYHFLTWDDGVTELNRTVMITGDKTYVGTTGYSYVDIDVTANAWTFFCLPQPNNADGWTSDMLVYDQLDDIEIGTYNSTKRAQAQSGWELTLDFNSLKSYIIYSSTTGRLRLNVYPENLSTNAITVPLNEYEAVHDQNANWNFLGNPYNASVRAASIRIEGGEDLVTATIWNGTGYDNELLSSESLMFAPLQAFFVQTKTSGALTFPGTTQAGGAPRRNAPVAVEENSRIDIQATAGGYTDKTRVLFRANSSLKYEAGVDASKFMTATAPVQFYFLDVDNIQCAQMVRPAGEDNIRLGYMLRQAGEIEINMPIYADNYELYDALTDRSYDLSEEVSIYSEKGTYNNRLMLRPIHRVPTAISNTGAESTTTKLFINGQLYIIRDGKTYTVQGTEAR